MAKAGRDHALHADRQAAMSADLHERATLAAMRVVEILRLSAEDIELITELIEHEFTHDLNEPPRN
jgi:hypothetical protein